MAGDVIYLDSDDEITSAAARIRGVEGRRAAVVLPYGSRVATSRINFRLLARDALTHEKRLSIIAADAATRALAASAGLPVFATVSEYEEAMAAERAERAGGPADAAGPAGAVAAVGDAIDDTADHPIERSETIVSASGRETAAAAAAGAAGGAAADGASTPDQRRARPSSVRPIDHAGGSADDTAAVGAAGAGPGVDAPPRVRPAPRLHEAEPLGAAAAGASATPRTQSVARPAGRGIGRTGLLIGVAVIALAVIVAGVGAYLFLPSATAVVTPREESIGPLSLRIVARTDVTEPDVDAGVVPAESIDIAVEASDTFPATGTRVEEAKAKGTVRFSSYDPTATNTIAKGAVVSTGSGVRFRTDKAVTVPAAELVGVTIFPATADVAVTAVDAGPDGNVEPNAILTVPKGENPEFLKVTNPDATSGGTRKEFPRVTQEDVDAAVAALGEQLQGAFADRLDDEDLVTGDASVFPETAQLGLAVPSVDPDSLVGQEVESFDLGATASGTVIAVDAAPVRAIAEARLASSVEEGYDLVDGSSDITEAPAVVEGGTITYPVVVTARQVARLDPAALKAEILGASVEEARALLESYGEVDLVVWPDWVATIPTIDSRVEVTVRGPIGIETPSPEPTP